MAEPIETVIVRAQQNFETGGGHNPVQIEIEDDRVLNILKKPHKNVVYKLTPLGMLFSACIKNDTKQILITCRELNNIKKSLINSKIYGLLGITDLKILIIETKLKDIIKGQINLCGLMLRWKSKEK